VCFGDSSARDDHCVLRQQTGNSSMDKRNLHRNRVDCQGKVLLFKHKCDELKYSQPNLESSMTCKEEIRVNHTELDIIAHPDEANTTENPIIPCTEDNVSCVLGGNHLKATKSYTFKFYFFRNE
jgi:hypothetical protein